MGLGIFINTIRRDSSFRFRLGFKEAAFGREVKARMLPTSIVSANLRYWTRVKLLTCCSFSWSNVSSIQSAFSSYLVRFLFAFRFWYVNFFFLSESKKVRSLLKYLAEQSDILLSCSRYIETTKILCGQLNVWCTNVQCADISTRCLGQKWSKCVKCWYLICVAPTVGHDRWVVNLT